MSRWWLSNSLPFDGRKSYELYVDARMVAHVIDCGKGAVLVYVGPRFSLAKLFNSTARVPGLATSGRQTVLGLRGRLRLTDERWYTTDPKATTDDVHKLRTLLYDELRKKCMNDVSLLPGGGHKPKGESFAKKIVRLENGRPFMSRVDQRVSMILLEFVLWATATDRHLREYVDLVGYQGDTRAVRRYMLDAARCTQRAMRQRLRSLQE